MTSAVKTSVLNRIRNPNTKVNRITSVGQRTVGLYQSNNTAIKQLY